MKSFIAGLLTIIVFGLVGFYTFKTFSKFMSGLNPLASSSPSPVATAMPSTMPSPKPTETPAPDNTKYVPTTKGGLPLKTQTGTVKGVSTVKTITTTTTTSHLTLTLVKSSICPISYMVDVKDITGPLTLKYKLADNTSFGITVWNNQGNEMISNTTYSGNSGNIKTISGVDYLKVRVESKTCASNNDNWLQLTAER